MIIIYLTLFLIFLQLTSRFIDVDQCKLTSLVSQLIFSLQLIDLVLYLQISFLTIMVTIVWDCDMPWIMCLVTLCLIDELFTELKQSFFYILSDSHLELFVFIFLLYLLFVHMNMKFDIMRLIKQKLCELLLCMLDWIEILRLTNIWWLVVMDRKLVWISDWIVGMADKIVYSSFPDYYEQYYNEQYDDIIQHLIIIWEIA